MRGRYESPEVWRAEGIFEEKGGPHMHKVPRPERPKQPSPGHYKKPADYLEQTLVADYPRGSIKDVFLMLKTGGLVMWDRLPIHLATTLTRVDNFAIYSDMAGSVAGYEVIDILKDLPKEILESADLTSYRQMRTMRSEGYNWVASDIDFHGRNDGWANDKYKNIPMLADAYKRSPESKWFVFMDDDTYMLWDNLDAYLGSMDPMEPIYLGSRAWFPIPQEHKGQKVKIFAHGGSGVVISKGAMDRLFGPQSGNSIEETVEKWSLLADTQCCGDLMVAWALFESGGVLLDDSRTDRPITRFQGEPIYTTFFNEETMCEPLMSFHHLRGHEIEILWEYERLNSRAEILYQDIYRDFVLPYIVDEREDWYMDHATWEFNGEQSPPYFDPEGNEVLANQSKELCRRACELEEFCYVWSYWEGTCQLQLDKVVLGIKATRDLKDFSSKFPGANKVYTGWMVDRIRQLRANLPCDPLTYDKTKDRYNDTPETAEGWALRLLRPSSAQT